MILALNTSTLQFGLALLEENGTVLGELSMSKGKRHFAGLIPALHFLLTTSKSDIQEIDCLVVAVGPGSFTGLRVGLSAAKGLCHSLKVPVVGVSSLEAAAIQLPYSHHPTAAILHSRKGEVFTALFSWRDGHTLIRNTQDMALRFEGLPSLCEKPTVFVGDDFPSQGPLIREMLGPRAILAPAYLWNIRPSAVGFLGLKRVQALDFDDPQGLNPVYLRPPEIRPTSFPLRSDGR